MQGGEHAVGHHLEHDPVATGSATRGRPIEITVGRLNQSPGGITAIAAAAERMQRGQASAERGLEYGAGIGEAAAGGCNCSRSPDTHFEGRPHEFGIAGPCLLLCSPTQLKFPW